MSCHFTCSSSCSGSSFNQCTICDSALTLINSACFCSTAWDSACTDKPNYQILLVALDTFFMVLFPLLMLLFCLKVNLPIGYRILSGLQSISLLIFSDQLYYYFQDQFGLQILAKSHGSYHHSNRLDSLSIDFALGPLVLLGGFTLLYFGLYPLYQVFSTEKYEDYFSYLSETSINFLYSFFFFSCKMMSYYIGMWISNPSTEVSVLIFFILFSAIIVGVVLKFIYDFHQDNINQSEIYPSELYLYSILSSLSMIGLPLASNTTMYIVVYLSPLALLILTILLNKGYKVCQQIKVGFYVTEILMAGAAVGFIVLNASYKMYLLLGVIVISVIAMVVEMIIVYNSGVEYERSSKVHPQPSCQEDVPLQVKDVKTRKQNKNTYF